ncbi:nitroreductase family protein [Olegusella massiliensis]|uniref:nitroreductase family protein n=1 Tax=Olegusella massiliensis TaxID=1776381 RepID=UPI000838166D|nr:nitroreductase family protein [Olegusella massiliensis]
MDFLSLAQARFSCKAYTDTPIDDQQLAVVLEAGRLAPTAKNSQPQRIYVLKSSDALAKVDEITPCRYGAPIVLLVCYDADAVFHYPQSSQDSGAEDAAIVTTHMMLAAANEGLGSCWVNLFNPEQTQQIFDLPKQYVPVALLDLGHAAADGVPLKNHELRKPLSETVSYL